MYYEKVPSDAELEAQPLAGPSAHGTATATARATLRVQILLVCAAYATVGPTLVLVNNHILRSLNFPLPLILSAFGLVTTSVSCAFIIHVLPRLRRVCRRKSPLEELQTPHSSLEGGVLASPSSPESRGPSGPAITFQFWLMNMIPIGAAQGLTFFGTNAAYMYLTITFTQMLAAFTPTVTMALLYLSGVEAPTLRAGTAVLAIGFGCALSSYGEGQFNLVGVLLHASASHVKAM